MLAGGFCVCCWSFEILFAGWELRGTSVDAGGGLVPDLRALAKETLGSVRRTGWDGAREVVALFEDAATKVWLLEGKFRDEGARL